MIPFASQRANGQDLAVHLMNEQDNDQVELMDLRGSVSNDLSGAFAEWDFQAKSFTRCKKYLYSLSLNPDPSQGQLTHEQYMDYLGDVEKELGLEEQGRAVVRHVKHGREHYHAVYSRIDTEEKRAIPISFDKMKLMRLTRDFAERHNLDLPKGYDSKEERAQRSQQSLYDKVQEQETGISKTERSAFITDCWKRRDTPSSFVAELKDNGYILATGRRPYLLVDRFGHINSLPRLIEDPSVKLKHVREFLGEAYPEESLPDAEWVKENLPKKHQQTKSEAHQYRRDKQQRSEALKLAQQQRRSKLQRDRKLLKEYQRRDLILLSAGCEKQMEALRGDYQSAKQKSDARAWSKEDGLRYQLAKVSGYLAISKAIRRYQDKRRLKSFQENKADLKTKIESEKSRLSRIHDLQLLEFQRKERALHGIEKREMKSLETSLHHARVFRMRRGLEHMPALNLTLSPPGRPMNIHRARHRYTHSEKVYKSRDEDAGLAEYFNEQANPRSTNSDSESPTFEKTDRDNRRKR